MSLEKIKGQPYKVRMEALLSFEDLVMLNNLDCDGSIHNTVGFISTASILLLHFLSPLMPYITLMYAVRLT